MIGARNYFWECSLLSPGSWKAINFLIIENGTGEVIKGNLLSLPLAILSNSWFQSFLTRTRMSPFQLPCFTLIEIPVNRKDWKAYVCFLLPWLITKEGFPQSVFWIFFIWQPGTFTLQGNFTILMYWISGGICLFLFFLLS